MRAMVMRQARAPLEMIERETPEPGPGQVRVAVSACAVCRTDLHVVDGELENPLPGVVPGHEIVGRIDAVGPGIPQDRIGERVGIPWLGRTCGTCRFCTTGRENLCESARFTGYQIDGGFATHTVANADYCFPLPDNYDDAHAAPLLCAGLIGYRSLKAAGEACHLGIYGFGAAAHIIAQVAVQQGRQLYAFTRPGDRQAQDFAIRMGCAWAGASGEQPPRPLEAAIVFAPVGDLLPEALRVVDKGGTVVLGGIYMSRIPAMPYALLWEERVIRSVANLTRQDAIEFLDMARNIPIETEITEFSLCQTNEALDRLRSGNLTGAGVIRPGCRDDTSGKS